MTDRGETRLAVPGNLHEQESGIARCGNPVAETEDKTSRNQDVARAWWKLLTAGHLHEGSASGWPSGRS